MKRKTSSALSLFLVLVLLIGVFPVTVFAANDEFVLTSINHLSAVSVVTVAEVHEAAFTVPYTHSGTVDFSSGLDITYDTNVYASASASFPSVCVAAVDGDPVAMTVTYQKKDDTALYTTQYSISVVRAAAVAPSFTGTISKAVTLPGSLTFTAADFTGKYTKNDGGALASIVITGSNPTFGAFKWGSENYVFGTAVSVSELEAGILTFAATTEGTVSYTVKAYAEANAETLIGLVTLTITASAAENKNAGTVTYASEENTPVVLKAADFTDAFLSGTGDTLSYVMFSLPPSVNGTLYYNYTSAACYDGAVSSGTKYYTSALPEVSLITFVPAADYAGTLEIAYTAYNTAGSAYAGKVAITVTEKDTSPHFNDVGRGHAWAAAAIEHLYKQGIIVGNGHGYYNPNASISRGDFILMLCRAFNLHANAAGNFSDVDEDSYYSSAVATAKALKIAKGTGGKFNPKASLSRQDAMVLLFRAAEEAGITIAVGSEGDLDGYADSNKISDYALNATAALVRAGIIEGNDRKLNPKASVSRAEMAVILHRILAL